MSEYIKRNSMLYSLLTYFEAADTNLHSRHIHNLDAPLEEERSAQLAGINQYRRCYINDVW